jgi:hypothetical protein
VEILRPSETKQIEEIHTPDDFMSNASPSATDICFIEHGEINSQDEETRRVIDTEFYVVQKLNTALIVGEDSLNALRANELNLKDFVQTPEDSIHPDSMHRIMDVSNWRGQIFNRARQQLQRITITRGQENNSDVEGNV